MAEATMTTKGQITVPKAVREELALIAGDRVEFVRTAQGFLIKPRNSSLMELRGMLAHLAVPSPQEQEANEREALAKKYGP